MNYVRLSTIMKKKEKKRKKKKKKIKFAI